MSSRPEDLTSRSWDFIIIGTGMGGATIGYELARQGRSVLFCEAGRSYLTAQDTLQGDWLDALTGGKVPSPEQLDRAGRSRTDIYDISSGKPILMRPVLGTGIGGTSALYGMVMERFFPSDFEPGQYFRDCPEANLPEKWPITYDELAPYYTQAERIYGVKATKDPLHPDQRPGGIVPPPPLTPASGELMNRFEAKGLHPYRLPMACNYVEGCRECVGFICDKRCKRDSATSCLEPALRDHGADMITGCEIHSLDSANNKITAVNARWRGQEIKLSAKTIILGAGAIRTAVLLLNSGEKNKGLANGSDQVGRNLMRHLLDYYLVYPKAPSSGLLKQIAFNDLYLADGKKFGTVQSNGRLPPASTIAKFLREELRTLWPPLAYLFPLIRPAIEFRIGMMLSRAHVLAAFLEDLPFKSNRVTPSRSGGVDLFYRINPCDQRRLREFRRQIPDLIGEHRYRSIFRAEQNATLGHVCGTCRFGDDPRTSVLDRFNRAHELDNLYVVDGSFLPTSSGTNPALTIAANALRVADHLSARH
ncbi:GMC family oxidoreductase [Mesorhizobium sp. M3A.F.Ca.ET.174.01.1.1]|uniref:GMC oxidoreductase n=1 Tax=unclassified Mesorhizobium TaxID=325217 RepID=UPI00109344F3|nr:MULTISPECIES: GMC family oxidoreductase [unclassified Mesorhizobium]TGS87462.1 GMC family oxidoreductase [Mesorhizobium sp. M3A.F.Ca.ET.175.01.1.1]TGT27922.1 GMC family oxidoreductase [Mesorhizobium sp. M3A.F.Ca.ET.174.01.1.1]